MTGTTISHYAIGRKLGEGGMGVVYQARDTSLDRTVAIKILHQQEAGGEARQRLLREARTAAALNHPNICTIHEAVEWDEQCLLVMEYVEGETLHHKIAERPLRLPEALDIAIQLTGALQAAHQLDIVHRDIKASNIMLTPAGQVKVLDFGLARRQDQDPVTVSGVCIGTPSCMSPEQAQGKRGDRRSDIWALGVLLYEMITGSLPFAADSQAGMFQQILHFEPEPLTARRSGVPIDLDRVVGKALAKDPGQRYQHVEDLAVDLQAAKRLLSGEHHHAMPSGTAPAAALPVLVWKRTLPWALACLLAIVAAGGGWYAWQHLGSSRKTMRFISRLPGEQSFSSLTFFSSAITISRNGESIVYAAREGKKAQLWHRQIGEEEARPIEGTEDAAAPFLSPENSWVGFVHGKSVKRVSFAGGVSDTITENPMAELFNVDVAFFGGSFSPKSDAILAGECTRGLRRFHLARKTKEKTTDIFANERFSQHQFPQILPGGRYALFTEWMGESNSQLAVLDMETNQVRTLVSNATYGRYVPTGHLVYGWANNLYAVPFHLGDLRVTGPPVAVVKGVMMNLVRGAVQFDVSDSGTLVYIPGAAFRSSRRMGWVDRRGIVKEVEGAPRLEPGALRISEDGTRVLTMARSPETGRMAVATFDFERRVWQDVAAAKSGVGNWWPIWSADGKRILYNEMTRGPNIASVHWKPLDPSAPSELLVPDGQGYQQPTSMSRAGDFLLYQEWLEKLPKAHLWVMPLFGERKPRRFLNSSTTEVQGEFSPDGKWLAYSVLAENSGSIMVRSFPDGKEVLTVATGGAWEPVWSRDGKQIYYRSRNGKKIFAVDFVGTPDARVGVARLLAEGEFEGGNAQGRTWDVSPDGSRFLVWLRDEQQAPLREYHVVLNWDQDLKRLVR